MSGGRASDLIGRKWVTIAPVALFGLLSILTAQATNATTLLWMRSCTGLGLGGALPNHTALNQLRAVQISAANDPHARRDRAERAIW